MLNPRRRRGVGPLVAVAAAVALPAPAALASPQALPQVGSVVATTGAATTGDGAAIGPPAAVPVPVKIPLTGGACSRVSARPSSLSKATARAALMCAINRARAASGLAGLGGDRHLRRAATEQADDMVRYGYFAHQRAGGPSLGQRLSDAGWHGSRAGEALAWGCGTAASADATVQAWLASPPHREILLGAYSRAGVGVARKAPAACGPGATWVLDAGS
jgi:uncharacterized protein YkwD